MVLGTHATTTLSLPGARTTPNYKPARWPAFLCQFIRYFMIPTTAIRRSAKSPLPAYKCPLSGASGHRSHAGSYTDRPGIGFCSFDYPASGSTQSAMVLALLKLAMAMCSSGTLNR